MNTGTAAASWRGLLLGRDTVALQTAARLATYVAECVTTGVARRVLLVRLSRLPRILARPHHLRLVHEALEPLASASRAQVFHLPGGDIAIAWRGAEDVALARSRDVINRLFEDAAVQDPGVLLSVLRLPEDSASVLAELEPRERRTQASADAEGELPLEPQGLVRLEHALAQADIARFVRREPVRAAIDGGFRIAWERRFMSADDVAAELMPGANLRADPWLFARLTRTFDHRMLALLAASAELHGVGPFSLDLNVASLLGPEFMRFDAVVPPRLRGKVVIDLMAPDVLADLGAFSFARDFAAERGYRLGLRGIGAELAPVLPAGTLGFDFVTIRWTADWNEIAPDFTSLAPARLVLAGADTAASMAWARAHGITLLEGAASA